MAATSPVTNPSLLFGDTNGTLVGNVAGTHKSFDEDLQLQAFDESTPSPRYQLSASASNGTYPVGLLHYSSSLPSSQNRPTPTSSVQPASSNAASQTSFHCACGALPSIEYCWNEHPPSGNEFPTQESILQGLDHDFSEPRTPNGSLAGSCDGLKESPQIGHSDFDSSEISQGNQTQPSQISDTQPLASLKSYEEKPTKENLSEDREVAEPASDIGRNVERGTDEERDSDTVHHKGILKKRSTLPPARKAVYWLSIFLAIGTIITVIIVVSLTKSNAIARGTFLGGIAVLEVAVAAGMWARESSTTVEILIAMNLVFVCGIFFSNQIDSAQWWHNG